MSDLDAQNSGLRSSAMSPGIRRIAALRTYPITGGVAVAAIGIVIIAVLGGNYYGSIFVFALCYAFVTLGMAIQVGYSNQLILSQAAFMGLGAYGVAVLNTKFGLPVPLSILVLVVAGGLVGLLLGTICMRATGLAIGLATLFIPLIVASSVIFWGYLGGSVGLGGVGSLVSGPTIASATVRSGLVEAALLGLCVLACARVLRSGVGLELALMGEDARAADAVGVRTRRRKLELWVLGSALAALGGGVFAATQSFVSTTNFDQTAELTLLVMLYLGGRRSIYGALIGTVVLEFLSGSSNYVSLHLLTIEGVLFTVVLLGAPDGLVGIGGRLIRAVQRAAERQPEDEQEVQRPVRPAAAEPQPAAQRPHFVVERSAADGDDTGAGGPVLAVRELTKRYGGVVAVDEVTFEVSGNGIHAIVGPNGAGKSTFFDLVAGATRPTAGRVSLFGADVTDWQVARRARLGVARTFQAVRLVQSLSVLDNVAVAALRSHDRGMAAALVRSELREAREKAQEALDEFGLGDLARRRPDEVTLEAQRMTELARATVSGARLLLLDEPASGLSVEQRFRLADALVRLGRSRTILLVEHDLVMVEEISRQVLVLIDGRVAYSGSGGSFREHPEVRARLLGLVDPAEAAALRAARLGPNRATVPE
ncbi:MAG: branched-chain amino acid transport system ATP-binding protein livF [Trebonia sp.]|jgi:branched-chain amino acid transport system permease protein|nr:branched-chain amino acid transport system ATP-binding protein livF [Trebonia sp.]